MPTPQARRGTSVLLQSWFNLAGTWLGGMSGTTLALIVSTAAIFAILILIAHYTDFQGTMLFALMLTLMVVFGAPSIEWFPLWVPLAIIFTSIAFAILSGEGVGGVFRAPGRAIDTVRGVRSNVRHAASERESRRMKAKYG